MNEYFTDFSNEPLGNIPRDNPNWIVDQNPGNYIAFAPDHHGCIWIKADNKGQVFIRCRQYEPGASVVESLTRVIVWTNNHSIGSYGILGHRYERSAPYGLTLGYIPSYGRLSLFLNDDTRNEGIAYYHYNWLLNTPYWVRFRSDNNRQYAKIWRDGEAEPANWQIDAIRKQDYNGGEIGLVNYTGRPGGVGVTYTQYSFATGGASAPRAQNAIAIQGSARIERVDADVIRGKAVINKNVATQIKGRADILKSVTTSIIGKSKVITGVNKDIQLKGKARLNKYQTKQISGKSVVSVYVKQAFIKGRSRIHIQPSLILLGSAVVAGEATTTIKGLSRIYGVYTASLKGKSVLRRPPRPMSPQHWRNADTHSPTKWQGVTTKPQHWRNADTHSPTKWQEQ